jgi:hypothetical protein
MNELCLVSSAPSKNVVERHYVYSGPKMGNAFIVGYRCSFTRTLAPILHLLHFALKTTFILGCLAGKAILRIWLHLALAVIPEKAVS